MSRKGGTGKACGVHQKGANSMVVSGLTHETGSGYVISLVSSVNGPRKQSSHRLMLSARASWHCPSILVNE